VNAKHAKNAISHVKTISVKENLAFVKIRIETGRTHQIRVHLSSINTPVLGDSVYGCLATNKAYKVKRQLLHSHKLVFTHPITKKIMEIEAPLPKDFENFLP
jgi:23S rRNA pseudouridine1911/1915/1917 synthase